ncbi:hypothetical protein W97_01648 [Coniosporium apollinis CBS 100218]|uniref:Uncharacterized protein n=1 Tax=Coniosporium apollinis (strain CBS 100218) TaxID=1168221 RepID=R7YLA5_CONA1|nr:uncharacterized protein W97_01648 [Coniosporium apollinis CBS 100218]EON62426.1 hypothetical protein W97_01648 [Coniosporium apollinis CBS 100218]
MAPTRRYLRITKYSVLEVRVYLDEPSQQQSWLLRSNDPALPRVIEAVRPLVLPKLREENERAKGKKGGKGRGVKDVVTGDDFEVSVFLTEYSTRHSLLTRSKAFAEKPRMRSNSGKLTGWLTSGTSEAPVTIRDENDEDNNTVSLLDIPEAPQDEATDADDMLERPSRRGKRRRETAADDLFVHSSGSDDEDAFQTQRTPASKRRRRRGGPVAGADPTSEDGDEETNSDPGKDHNDKKKLAMKTSYDGFSIYGRILCLVVKRKGHRVGAGRAGGNNAVPSNSQQAMMENWVSTQAVREHGGDEEDEG